MNHCLICRSILDDYEITICNACMLDEEQARREQMHDELED